MKRRRVKLGLAGLVVAEIITYCRGIILKMTDNPHFPIADNPHNALLETAVNELETADIAAADGGKTLTATLRQKKAAVYDRMRPYRDFVNEKADGDEEIVNTTGFALAKLPAPKGGLGIPGDVRTKTLPAPGEVEVYCQKVDGATGYQIRHRPINGGGPGPTPPPIPGDPTNPDPVIISDAWVMEDPLGQLRQKITGLESAMYHEFQMRAIGAKKPSPWSGSVNGLAA